LFPGPDFFDDGAGIGGPDERLWIVIGLGEVSVDGRLEIDDPLEDTSLEALPGQPGEEPFDGVELRGRGRCEVEMESWMPFERLRAESVLGHEDQFPPMDGECPL
jgi:hypothetical protein